MQLSFLWEIFKPAVKPARRPIVNDTRFLSVTELSMLWQQLAIEYFPACPNLMTFKIKWSRRGGKRLLASCNNQRKTINVSHVLANPKFRATLAPLLYHEMCHAVLGEPKRVNGRFQIHGKDFKQLEKLHPQTAELNKWIKSGGWTSARRSYGQLNRLR
ncbi:MAG: SprT-like domain-containing protein [Deltaproteobacteria bacterium]|nr:SprT-like domain-containing protein [Deltaproteobacteria bacterium]